MVSEIGIVLGLAVWSYLGLRLLNKPESVTVPWPVILLAGPAIWILSLIVVLGSIRIKNRK